MPGKSKEMTTLQQTGQCCCSALMTASKRFVQLHAVDPKTWMEVISKKIKKRSLQSILSGKLPQVLGHQHLHKGSKRDCCNTCKRHTWSSCLLSDQWIACPYSLHALLTCPYRSYVAQ